MSVSPVHPETPSAPPAGAAYPSMTLRPFEARWAENLCAWVDDETTLRLLAPGTTAPLTPEKVVNWVKPGGYAATGWISDRTEPIAYGEINPMPRRPGHYWMGHVIVRPDLRGRGFGLAFVRALLGHAFEHRKAREVALIVFPDNVPAIECYLRAGFRAAGRERHRFRADGPVESLLRFEITPARLGRTR